MDETRNNNENVNVQQAEGLTGQVNSQVQETVQDIVGEAANQPTAEEQERERLRQILTKPRIRSDTEAPLINNTIKNMEVIESNRFSIFPSGWMDEAEERVKPRQKPQQTQTIGWTYEYIKSERARWATEMLRALSGRSRDERRDFKVLHFEYATFSGIFSYRNARSLIERTPFLTIDIDDLSGTDEARRLRDRLVGDRRVETALCFVSPSGCGVKWIVELPVWARDLPFREQFEQVRRYVGFNYGYDADKSGSDVCRACFLPWDGECYVNEKYVEQFKSQKNYERD